MVASALPGPGAPARARSRIRQIVRQTPVLSSRSINSAYGLDLVFKSEHLQRTGSFKIRGAAHAVGRLPADCPGVATHSSGNHGAALACAAAKRGMAAHVVMPEDSVSAKVEAVRAYGGTVHFCEPSQAGREQGLSQLVARGLVPIPPYDHAHVIAGQGTCALEFLEQVPDLEVIVVPVGGGGLISGTALAAAAHRNPVRVIGVEPAGADDTCRSLSLGRRVEDHRPDTIADGLRALVGELTFPLIQAHVDRILTVSEAQILEGMELIWSRMKQVVEPSGAVALAGTLAHAGAFRGMRVGIILSGGNVDCPALLGRKQETGNRKPG